MHLYKKDHHAWVVHDGKVFTHTEDWDLLINRIGLYDYLLSQLSHWTQVDMIPDLIFDPPIKSQEVWAAGVTYLRSKVARMEESQNSGGGDFYDKVYAANRPELFFKAQPYRVAGTHAAIKIRGDSSWNVPEPELTLFISSFGTIEAYTVGNDVSSRSIEGENPLYLPQAKSYEGSTAIGPCLYIPQVPIEPETSIQMEVFRSAQKIFSHAILLKQMKRSLPELAEWLFKELKFPHGTFLMTGTGIVPPDDFTLQIEDRVEITIEGIGSLINTVKP